MTVISHVTLWLPPFYDSFFFVSIRVQVDARQVIDGGRLSVEQSSRVKLIGRCKKQNKRRVGHFGNDTGSNQKEKPVFWGFTANQKEAALQRQQKRLKANAPTQQTADIYYYFINTYLLQLP